MIKLTQLSFVVGGERNFRVNNLIVENHEHHVVSDHHEDTGEQSHYPIRVLYILVSHLLCLIVVVEDENTPEDKCIS